jgi:dCMP deaminase
MNPRIEFDDMFMKIVKIVAKRSSCLSRQVGAVLTMDNRIVATGYNGPPSKIEHCSVCKKRLQGFKSTQGQDKCPAVHAEQNIIISCAKYGIKIKEATIYLSCGPCSMCAKLLISVDIKTIIYKGVYNDLLAISLLEEAGFKSVADSKYNRWVKS